MTEESSGGRIVSRRGVLKITGTAAAFSLAGCSGSGGSSESTFTIGALHPLSGDAAEMGTRFQDVVGAGVQAVNQGADLSPLAGAEGEGIQGQDGATVEVLWRDHQGASDVARSEAESLVLDEDVDMLTGCFYSGSTQAGI